jgi:DNA (cytosine-5)-methyltransferase 1
MAQALYQIIAKTLDAFDYGLISSEEDLSDLDALLEQRGQSHPQQRRTTSFALGTSNRTSNNPHGPSWTPESFPFRRSNGSEPEPMRSRRRTEAGFPSMNALDGAMKGIENFRSTASSGRSDGRRRKDGFPNQDDEVIYIPSDSE